MGEAAKGRTEKTEQRNGTVGRGRRQRERASERKRESSPVIVKGRVSKEGKRSQEQRGGKHPGSCVPSQGTVNTGPGGIGGYYRQGCRGLIDAAVRQVERGGAEKDWWRGLLGMMSCGYSKLMGTGLPSYCRLVDNKI